MYQKQYDQGYVDNIGEYKELLRPQLAHKYKDKKHIIWNISDDIEVNRQLWASRKLNGIRCFIFVKDNKVVKFESRTGKDFKFFSHISKDIELLELNEKDYILDGELFNKDIPFEVICSLVNSDEYIEIEYEGKLYNTDMVQFHMYDFIASDSEYGSMKDSYYDRFIDNFSLMGFGPSIHYVSNEEIKSEEQVFELTKKWMDEGYEGLMLRAGWSIYEFGQRSSYLLKVKLFESEEFKIKDTYLAENDVTKVMFILYNHHNNIEPYNIFDCSIKGNKEFNMQYYLNKEQYIDKWCTVTYQALSSYSVPLFAQIETIREGEEIDGQFRPSW